MPLYHLVVRMLHLPLRYSHRQNLSIWHFDFYRFNDPREWEDAGFRDIFASVGLKICEWPDKAQGVLPPADLDIHFSVNADGSRDVRLLAHTELGEDLTA